MTDERDALAWLRHLLSQAPSQSLFSRMLLVLEGVSDEGEQALAIDYVAQHLEPWDPRLRHACWHELWSGEPGEQPSQPASLVRSVQLPTLPPTQTRAGMMDSLRTYFPEMTAFCLGRPGGIPGDLPRMYELSYGGLSHFVFTPELRERVQHLSIFHASVDEENPFFEKNVFPELRTLRLMGCFPMGRYPMGTRHGAQLPKSLARAIPHRLESLGLTSRNLATRDVKTYLSLSPFCHLESLDLSHNPIGQIGVLQMTKAPCRSTLKHLKLVGCGATHGADVFWQPLPQLESLRLDFNDIGAGDLELNAPWKLFPMLRSLCLSCNRFGPGDGPFLARCLSRLPQLERLDLSYNQLATADLQELLCAMAAHPSLLQLQLQGNAGREELCRTFVRSGESLRRRLVAQLQEPLSRFFRLLHAPRPEA